MAVIMSKQIVLPVMGKLLYDYAEGDIVYLNENGSPVPFYVTKHNYERALNGFGRTLLVRADMCANQQWHSSDTSKYASSSINSWLNSTYKELLDTNVTSAAGTTKFYYTIGGGDYSISTLSRSVFLLSSNEFGGVSGQGQNAEGTPVPIAHILAGRANSGGWTRSPHSGSDSTVLYVNGFFGNINDGQYSNTGYGYPNGGSFRPTSRYGFHPCLTLPSVSLFNGRSNEFLAVTNESAPIPKSVAVAITGSGNLSYCNVKINNTAYSSAANIEVIPGDFCEFQFYGSSLNYGNVTINGVEVSRQDATGGNYEQYRWFVPKGITSISIAFNYKSSSNSTSRYARITVTTS